MPGLILYTIYYHDRLCNLLCVEFLSRLLYSPQCNKYITLCGLIATLYTLVFRTLTKHTFFSHDWTALEELGLLYEVPRSLYPHHNR